MIQKVLGISVMMMFLSCSAYSMSLSNVINIAIKTAIPLNQRMPK